MTEPTLYISLSMAALAGLAMIVIAGLSGWRDWLALKRRELDGTRGDQALPTPNAGARIEIADLKERIRKLEAIAAGVDL
ncbi:hypothetical protein [Sphingomonas oligophenolica]|uniref:Uncharacterized protein n=1 Tax=Sphingomonas oligophenolica TaxID=301154 RepID=A0A502CIY2_9SPHN|nr:hypothetical protein [Sphingomonas oligophenolica]TPG12773.1 hypothetical protein EAH84_08390 [Sphingomonas oligophenolica]